MTGCGIVGIGSTAFTRRSGRPVSALAVEAARHALADAGLAPDDIDGVVPIGGNVFSEDLIAGLGLTDQLADAQPPPGGNSAVAGVALATTLLLAGRARAVVVVFARNGSSATKIGARVKTLPGQTYREQLEQTAGWSTPAQWYAMMCRRHMHDFGTSKDAMAQVALAARAHAALNPDAMLHKRPLTREEYDNARMIADPYQRWDCCLETDGAVAVVVTTMDRVLDQARAVPIAAIEIARPETADDLTNRLDWHTIGLTAAALAAWERAARGPEDVGAAMIYDCFTFEVLHQLEEAGFCARGESDAFVRDGAIRLGGRLPVNTHGGLLAEGHLGGLSHVLEAVRQIRGEALGRNVGARLVAVTGWGDLGDGSLALLGS